MGIRHIKAFQRLIDVLRLAKIYLVIGSIPSDFNPEEVMDFTKVCYIESTRERFLYLGELISSRRKEKKVIHKDGNYCIVKISKFASDIYAWFTEAWRKA